MGIYLKIHMKILVYKIRNLFPKSCLVFNFLVTGYVLLICGVLIFESVPVSLPNEVNGIKMIFNNKAK